MSAAPPIAIGNVVAQDAKGGGVICMIRSAQLAGGSAATVKMGYDYADGVRISQKPLPNRGTWGLIAFPTGDFRNGIWICSILANQIDAIGSDTDTTLDYTSHWSGFWRWLSLDGTLAMQWPDGSSLVVGSGTSLPIPTRHTVNASQVQQTIPYTMTDRVSDPPNPFQLNYQMANGTSVLIDAKGDITISGPANVTINASGSITLNASANVILQQAGATAGDAIALISKLVAAFNAHVHGGVTSGGSDTSAPTVAWTDGLDGTVSSTLVEISN